MSRSVLRMGAVLIAIGVVACAAEPPQTTYVGKVQGSDAFVALVTDGEAAVAYTCGGQDSLSTQTGWFSGDVVIGSDSLLIDRGDQLFLARFTATGIDGSFIDNTGTYRHFTAKPTGADTLAGLYRSPSPQCATGAIVIQEDPNAAAELRGAWCNGGGVFAQVTPMFTPIEMTDDGLPVSIEFAEPLMIYVNPIDL